MRFCAVVIAVILAGCGASRLPGGGPVEVIHATSQQWFGGTEESGYGTNYRFRVVYDKTKDVTFDTMWIGERAYVPELSAFLLNQRKTIGPIDTIPLVCRYHKSNNPLDGYSEHPPKANGPPFKGAALLIYHFEGSRHTCVVDSIQPLEALYYP
jgi:hypothetical protein